MSTAASFLRAILDCAARGGADAAALLRVGDLDPQDIADRDARVPTSALLRILAAAVERTGNPALGAEVAGAVDGATFGLLGFVVASCATLREALGRFIRYSRLLCDELRVEVVQRADEVAIVYSLDAEPRVPAFFELAQGHLVLTARRGTKRVFRPRRVVFRHRGGPAAIAEMLGAPVAFGGAEDAVICDPGALDLPLRGANPALLGFLESHAAIVLERLPPEDDLLGRARHAVRGLLPDGEPSLGAVAARLGLGGRTLQRRLRDHGLTYRALVDDVRREDAQALLARPDVPVAEVAFSLGFSDPSAFHHAFRRWTGRSPRGGA
ncbi:MAG: AraC family transcriptional regulator [Minicystis sp.]